MTKHPAGKLFRLIGADGAVYSSETKGTFGGHRKTRVYGALDCKAASRAIAKGVQYEKARVFFANEADARAAGYRPCAVCMREANDAWKRAST